MSFQEVGGPINYVKYSESKPGDVLVEGWFIDTKPGLYGNQYYFIDECGKTTVLNKSGQLDYQMSHSINKEDFLRITYAGKIILEKGPMKGKESNQFKIERDPTRAGRVQRPQMEEIKTPEEIGDENPLI